MSGVFTGKEATIYVLFSPKTETVWKVGVTFSQDGNDWSTIKNNYLEYKQYYINKYGEPHDDFNFFSSPYKKMTAMKFKLSKKINVTILVILNWKKVL